MSKYPLSPAKYFVSIICNLEILTRNNSLKNSNYICANPSSLFQYYIFIGMGTLFHRSKYLKSLIGFPLGLVMISSGEI